MTKVELKEEPHEFTCEECKRKVKAVPVGLCFCTVRCYQSYLNEGYNRDCHRYGMCIPTMLEVWNEKGCPLQDCMKEALKKLQLPEPNLLIQVGLFKIVFRSAMTGRIAGLPDA